MGSDDSKAALPTSNVTGWAALVARRRNNGSCSIAAGALFVFGDLVSITTPKIRRFLKGQKHADDEL